MSLVELMTGVAILAILMWMAAPNFLQWSRNIQIKNAAGSIVNGLQRARAEAVARNTNVAFVLGTDTSWTVSVVAPAALIESRSGSEGSQSTTRTATPAAATTLTYNNYGIAVVNADGSDPLTQVDLAAVGSTQNMRVTIGVGGNAKMCNPNLASGSNASAC